MSVKKEKRRQRTGREILTELCWWAYHQGYRRVILETTASWDEVIAFYQAFGFEATHQVAGDVYFEMDSQKFVEKEYSTLRGGKHFVQRTSFTLAYGLGSPAADAYRWAAASKRHKENQPLTPIVGQQPVNAIRKTRKNMKLPEYEYKGLMAEAWDVLRGDTSNWADRHFYLEIIQKYGQPVLDVGCGTGRLLLDYAQQGVDIDGVDNSPEMLAICKYKANELSLKPK